MIPSQRHRFTLPGDVAYLNCSYLSPQLRSVTEAGRKGMRSKEQPWTVAPDDFFDPGDVVRERFATLTGVDAAGVALIPAASYGISVAAANLEILAGQTIVVLAEQFPSNVGTYTRGGTWLRPQAPNWSRSPVLLARGRLPSSRPSTSALPSSRSRSAIGRTVRCWIWPRSVRPLAVAAGPSSLIRLSRQEPFPSTWIS